MRARNWRSDLCPCSQEPWQPLLRYSEKGAQAAAGELGVTVQYQGSATADATQEIQVLNLLIAQKVTGLAISADDANALVSTGQTAMKLAFR